MKQDAGLWIASTVCLLGIGLMAPITGMASRRSFSSVIPIIGLPTECDSSTMTIVSGQAGAGTVTFDVTVEGSNSGQTFTGTSKVTLFGPNFPGNGYVPTPNVHTFTVPTDGTQAHTDHVRFTNLHLSDASRITIDYALTDASGYSYSAPQIQLGVRNTNTMNMSQKVVDLPSPIFGGPVPLIQPATESGSPPGFEILSTYNTVSVTIRFLGQPAAGAKFDIVRAVVVKNRSGPSVSRVSTRKGISLPSSDSISQSHLNLSDAESVTVTYALTDSGGHTTTRVRRFAISH